jgi:FkbM family methyltransferase
MADLTFTVRRPDDAHRTPVTLTGRADDSNVVRNIIESGGLYEPHVVTALARHLEPDDVVLDVGAHIGVIACLVAGMVPEGHVHAFEASRENFGYLERNLAANGIGNVSAERVAVYDGSIDHLELSVAADNTAGSFVAATDHREGDVEVVPAITLDAWAAEHAIERVDLVKLDVEGAEPRVLTGAAGLLRRCRPDLVVELNPLTLRRFQGSDHLALLTQLRHIFPRVAAIRDDGSLVDLLPVGSETHVRKLLSHKGMLDLFCTFSGLGPRGRAKERLRSTRDVARLTRRLNRFRSPERNFVYEPGGEFRFLVNALQGTPGAFVRLPVRIRNTTSAWFDSFFPQHPVTATYQWLDRDGRVIVANGMRTYFPEPVRPGGSAVLDLVVQLPSEPGEYVLLGGLVQEAFAWFHDVDGSLAARLPTIVG